jgi:beta-glucosidase
VVNGSRMTEHTRLLRSVLKDEWGFGGLVTSDWDATRSTVATAVGGLDLAMPGPNRFWGAALAEAVRAGLVTEAMVDDKVARLLAVARRVGALSQVSPAVDGHPDGHARSGADGGAAADNGATDGAAAGNGAAGGRPARVPRPCSAGPWPPRSCCCITMARCSPSTGRAFDASR